ncbi:hypothetical protein D1AOALGA4SA_10477 [Olavius algarvensis Delta 1 endosymbiont]|nr:hypothetical protein D1AOALGA4SA_10477 [Olavius algarvensis Delta 1 endosymbiont]
MGELSVSVNRHTFHSGKRNNQNRDRLVDVFERIFHETNCTLNHKYYSLFKLCPQLSQEYLTAQPYE